MAGAAKGKRRAEAAGVEPGSKDTAAAEAAAQPAIEELEFEDEFEDEFEKEEFVGEEGGDEEMDGDGAGSSMEAFPDDGVNPSIGGKFYRAGDEMGEGEELQV